MASPLPVSPAKRSVDLAERSAPGSRIRRDPPPAPAARTVVLSRSERDRNTVLAGIGLSTLLLLVLLVGFASYAGWSPREVVAHL